MQGGPHVFWDHHLDLPTLTVAEAEIPFHWTFHLAVHVNFGLAFGKHCIIEVSREAYQIAIAANLLLVSSLDAKSG